MGSTDLQIKSADDFTAKPAKNTISSTFILKKKKHIGNRFSGADEMYIQELVGF